MGDDYNHSTLIDLLLTGLLGLRPKMGNILEVHPLILEAMNDHEHERSGKAGGKAEDSVRNGRRMSTNAEAEAGVRRMLDGLDHFAVDHVLYHDHIISVVFDTSGSHYGGKFKAGLTVMVDGKEAAHSESETHLVVQL